jgi:hypothetical protein
MEFRPSPTSGSATLKAPSAAPKPTLTPPPKPSKVQLDDAVERLKTAASPQERSAVIRELRAGGAKPKDVGEKLSSAHAGNSPLDAEDLAQAKEILKAAGSFEKASKALDALDYTAAEKRSLLRALREASRAK